MGRQSVGGHREAASKWGKKRDVCTSSLDCACTVVLDETAFELQDVPPRDHSEWTGSPDLQ